MLGDILTAVFASALVVFAAGIINEWVLTAERKRVWWRFGILCLLMWLLISEDIQLTEKVQKQIDNGIVASYNEGYDAGYEDGEKDGIKKMKDKFGLMLENLASFSLSFEDIEYGAYTFDEIAAAVESFENGAQLLHDRFMKYK